jgi:hypothetical protein
MQMTPATSCTHGLDAMLEGGGAMFAVVSAGDKPGFPSEEFEAISPPNENYGASRAAPHSGNRSLDSTITAGIFYIKANLAAQMAQDFAAEDTLAHG